MYQSHPVAAAFAATKSQPSMIETHSQHQRSKWAYYILVNNIVHFKRVGVVMPSASDRFTVSYKGGRHVTWLIGFCQSVSTQRPSSVSNGIIGLEWTPGCLERTAVRQARVWRETCVARSPTLFICFSMFFRTPFIPSLCYLSSKSSILSWSKVSIRVHHILVCYFKQFCFESCIYPI